MKFGTKHALNTYKPRFFAAVYEIWHQTRLTVMPMMIICGAVYEIWHQTRVDYIQTMIICRAGYEIWHETRINYNTNKDYLWRGI